MAEKFWKAEFEEWDCSTVRLHHKLSLEIPRPTRSRHNFSLLLTLLLCHFLFFFFFSSSLRCGWTWPDTAKLVISDSVGVLRSVYSSAALILSVSAGIVVFGEWRDTVIIRDILQFLFLCCFFFGQYLLTRVCSSPLIRFCRRTVLLSPSPGCFVVLNDMTSTVDDFSITLQDVVAVVGWFVFLHVIYST